MCVTVKAIVLILCDFLDIVSKKPVEPKGITNDESYLEGVGQEDHRK